MSGAPSAGGSGPPPPRPTTNGVNAVVMGSHQPTGSGGPNSGGAMSQTNLNQIVSGPVSTKIYWTLENVNFASCCADLRFQFLDVCETLFVFSCSCRYIHFYPVGGSRKDAIAADRARAGSFRPLHNNCIVGDGAIGVQILTPYSMRR